MVFIHSDTERYLVDSISQCVQVETVAHGEDAVDIYRRFGISIN